VHDDIYGNTTKDQPVDYFPVGSTMCSLCHLFNKRYNAVEAILGGRQIGYEVDADSALMAFRGRKWYQEANRFPAVVVHSMA